LKAAQREFSAEPASNIRRRSETESAEVEDEPLKVYDGGPSRGSNRSLVPRIPFSLFLVLGRTHFKPTVAPNPSNAGLKIDLQLQSFRLQIRQHLADSSENTAPPGWVRNPSITQAEE
jgi:hypothetical protein